MRATQFNGADRWFGLIGRYIDSQNYYYVTLRNSNQISLKRLTNGVITTLDSAATTPVTANTWYDLRLDVVGTKLRAFMNGSLLLKPPTRRPTYQVTPVSAPTNRGRG